MNCQGPLFMEFSRQELPYPSQGDLPNPGVKPGSPALQADSLPSEPPGKSTLNLKNFYIVKETIDKMRKHRSE